MSSQARFARWALPFVVAVFASPAALQAADPDYAFIPVPKTGVNAAKPLPKYQFMFDNPARWPGPIRWRYNHSNAPCAVRCRRGWHAGADSCCARQLDAGVRHLVRLRGRDDDRAEYARHHPQFGEQPDEINVVGWGYAGRQRGRRRVGLVRRRGARADRQRHHPVDRARAVGVPGCSARRATSGAMRSDSRIRTSAGTLMSGPPDTQYNSLDHAPDRRRPRLPLPVRRRSRRARPASRARCRSESTSARCRSAAPPRRESSRSPTTATRR